MDCSKCREISLSSVSLKFVGVNVIKFCFQWRPDSWVLYKTNNQMNELAMHASCMPADLQCA